MSILTLIEKWSHLLGKPPIFGKVERPIYGKVEPKSETEPFFFIRTMLIKNVEAQITPKIKNIVVILLVAISISFPASDEI